MRLLDTDVYIEILLNNKIVLEEYMQSDERVAISFMTVAELKADLCKRKVLLPDTDIFIDSIALTKCSKLVTGNIKHFNRFENLVIENWLK
jgi:predicted nucleic acid-binding protein